MANQITPLNYANTFGDWLVTTNSVLAETNDIGINNYTKDSGTFTISSSGIGLQVVNNSLFQGVLTVSGTGSSALIQNSLTVQGTILATNTSPETTNTLFLGSPNFLIILVNALKPSQDSVIKLLPSTIDKITILKRFAFTADTTWIGKFLKMLKLLKNGPLVH